MNRKNIIAIIPLVLIALLSSCINDDSTEVEYYNDAAITSFTLTGKRGAIKTNGTMQKVNRLMRIYMSMRIKILLITLSCSDRTRSY